MPLYRAELLAKKPLRYAALIHNVSQVLYLPFDWDDGSYARDRSGYNNHGTIYGATLAAGKIGMARSFDGVDDRVKSNDYFSTPPYMTVSAWIRLTDVTDHRRIMNHHKVGDLGWYVSVYKTSGVIEVGSSPDGAAWSTFSGSVNVADGLWHFITAKWDGAKRYIFVDGAEDVSQDWAYTLHSPANKELLIGTNLNEADFFFKGIIDEPRICKVPLTLNEIRMLMYRRL